MNLRNKLIRLAHQKPELRKHLLPILKEAGSRNPYEVEFYCEAFDHESGDEIETDSINEVYAQSYEASLYDVFDKFIRHETFPGWTVEFSWEDLLKKNWKWSNQKKAWYVEEDTAEEIVGDENLDIYIGDYMYTNWKFYVKVTKEKKPLDNNERKLVEKALKSGQWQKLPKKP